MSKHGNLRRYALKTKLILMYGGKCIRCGYDNLHCVAAFEFHHRDPELKEFQINEAINQGRSWVEVVEEAKKCDLYCCRCHREIESEQPDVDITRYFEAFRNKRPRIDLPSPLSSIPDKPGMLALLTEYSMGAIARACHVSPGTIAYWCRRYGIRPNDRYRARREIPSRDELTELIKTKSAGQIGSQFGVSDRAVGKWLQKYGLVNPRRKIFYRNTKVFE